MKQKLSNPIPAPTSILYIACIGIDWADQKHDLYLFDPTTQQFEYSVIGSKPEAVATWVEDSKNDFLKVRFSCRDAARSPSTLNKNAAH